MGKITVVNNLTLDGVMQSPARPDEDTRGGFTHGGWGMAYNDPEKAQAMGAMMARGSGGAMLLGRRTYEDLYQVWPSRTDNPYTEVLNRNQKFVVSRTLEEPLPWQNSTLLKDIDAVVKLKRNFDGGIAVLGSGELIDSLRKQNLIDEYVLLIHPLVLGSGRRMFTDNGAYSTLKLTDSLTTSTGVIIATYSAG
jgi:dihydrofolate reductase